MILTITNLKGGAGKTTLATNLAALLAEQRNVLLVDLDMQADASLAMGGGDGGEGLRAALSGGAALERAVVQTDWGLDLVAAGEPLGHVLPRVQRDSLELHRDLFARYDFTIIDCPPGLGAVVAAAWWVADLALVPLDGPEALRAVGRLEQSWREIGLDPSILHLVPNRIDRRRRLDRELLRQAEAAYPERVLPPLRESVVVRESAAWRRSLLHHSPAHPLTADVRTLGQEVLHG